MSDENKALPKMALYLGYGGLIPFVALSVCVIVGYDIQGFLSISAETWLAIYAAVIISFLGAIHWGVVIAMPNILSESEANSLLVYSIVPSLLAWLSFLFKMPNTLFILGILVLFCFLGDYLLLFKKLESGLSKGFVKLRLHLTVVVSVCLIASAIKLS